MDEILDESIKVGSVPILKELNEADNITDEMFKKVIRLSKCGTCNGFYFSNINYLIMDSKMICNHCQKGFTDEELKELLC